MITDSSGSATTQVLRVGHEVFGRYNAFSYYSLARSPERLQPFSVLPDRQKALFPSPWSPDALRTEAECPIYANVEREFQGGGIAAAVLRNGRFWILLKNGSLNAHQVSTLEPVKGFEKTTWPDIGHLAASYHFVFGSGKQQGHWELRTLDAASGEPEPPPTLLEMEQPTVFFNGVEGAALGHDKASGRIKVQRLLASETGVQLQDSTTVKVSALNTPSKVWWGRAQGETYILCPDGVIRCWSTDSERFETIWDNEGHAWVGTPHRYRGKLLFPVCGAKQLRMVTVNGPDDVKETEILLQPSESKVVSSTVVDDCLYFLTKDRLLTWQLETYHIPTGAISEALTLNGSSDLLDIRLQRAAVKGVPYILISGRAASKWTFWGLNLNERKLESQLAGSPSATEEISFLWEGANTWMVRHSYRGSGGIIRCLPI